MTGNVNRASIGGGCAPSHELSLQKRAPVVRIADGQRRADLAPVYSGLRPRRAATAIRRALRLRRGGLWSRRDGALAHPAEQGAGWCCRRDRYWCVLFNHRVGYPAD